MTMIQSIGAAPERVMATLIAGLEAEFGHDAGEALAHRFLDAEEADFLWAARTSERWLGAYESLEEDEFEVDRIAILGRLNGRWTVTQLLVDGEGMAHGVLGRRDFKRLDAARKAYARMR
jgi:hypothetical protein